MTCCPVSCHNEWDPLEEVIVGTLQGAAVPTWHDSMRATMPERSWELFRKQSGRAFPAEQIEPAIRELDEFANVLRGEGVTVKRPEPYDFQRPFSTPEWQCAGGLYAAMPRDLLIVVGDRIIESPLAWRTRHCEIWAYRNLIKEYFKEGAVWIAAPTPRLCEETYDLAWDRPGEEPRYATTEYEPTFDAADFVRFGRDIFVQRSHVTNEFGIEWFQRQIGTDYRVHQVDVNDPHAMHIDATLVPLAPGKLLAHPERLPRVPPQLRAWDVLYAPEPCLPKSWPMHMASAWVSINILMLDPQRAIVEKQEEPLIRCLTDAGIECIPVSFRHVWTFGGSFHCVTCDIRRRGELDSYT